MFDVENIYTNHKQKLAKEESSHEHTQRLWEVIKFQLISIIGFASRTWPAEFTMNVFHS